ncbi:MAG: tetratricopeptide repeat protein [Ignavibacteria bacterium]|nr:tetratricopeptide repeat protein [Ignavibacteria bacterium]
MEITTPALASFAVTASELLMLGKTEEALQLSADGVRTFPDYVGGYVLLARAYQAIGYTDDARVILTEAQRRFPWYQLDDAVLRAEPVSELNAPSVPVTENISHTESAPVEIYQQSVPAMRPAVAGPFSHHSPLRIIEMAQPTSDTRIIRSSSVRVIPGLEFTSLTVQTHGQRTKRSPLLLPELKPMRRFEPTPTAKPIPAAKSTTTATPATAVANSMSPALTSSPAQTSTAQPDVVKEQQQTQGASTEQKIVSLEELAERISKARINADELVDRKPAPDPIAEHRQRVVTETLANIYMSQKNYTKAIESFRILKKNKPDQAAKFEARIQECLKLDAAQ